MYCKKCGTKMDDMARFCSSCGTSLNQDTMVKNQPDKIILTVKPVFIGWATFLGLLPVTLFLTVWGAGLFGGFTFMGINALTGGLDDPSVTWQPFVFWGVLFFFGVPLISYFGKKYTYKYTIYNFYGTKVEYIENFWTKEIKSVSYKRILEVNLKKGLLQQGYNLGTIVLSTAATGDISKEARSGITIANIENPDVVYNKIKQLVENCQ